MFGPRIGTGLSFGKVLGGISKTLGVVNELIPLYKEAKPLMNNARSAINLIKELGNNTTNRIMTKTSENITPIKEKIKTITNATKKNGPTFFQ